MPLLVSSATAIGTRGATNQDSLGLRVAETKIGPVALAVLCDGMGGLAQGEVASASTVSAFLMWFDRRLPGLVEQELNRRVIAEEWETLTRRINRAIYDYGRQENQRMGTTLTALLLTPTQHYLLSLGDTRAYAIAMRMRQLSRDHTLLAQEVSATRITSRLLNGDPRANVLVQCVGGAQQVRPIVLSGRAAPKTTYLLCTDGLYRTVPSSDLHRLFDPAVLKSQLSLDTAIAHAMAQNHVFRDRDDTSMIVLRT